MKQYLGGVGDIELYGYRTGPQTTNFTAGPIPPILARQRQDGSAMSALVAASGGSARGDEPGAQSGRERRHRSSTMGAGSTATPTRQDASPP
jgi:hypothetical protein